MIYVVVPTILFTVFFYSILVNLYLSRRSGYGQETARATRNAVKRIDAYKRMESDFKVVGDFAKFVVYLDSSDKPKFNIQVVSLYDQYSYKPEDEGVMNLEVVSVGEFMMHDHYRDFWYTVVNVDDKVDYLLRVKEEMKKKTGGEE